MTNADKFVRETFDLDTPKEIEVVTVAGDVEHNNATQGLGNTIKMSRGKAFPLIEQGKVRPVDIGVHKLIVAYAIQRLQSVPEVTDWARTNDQNIIAAGKWVDDIIAVYANIPLKAIGILPLDKAISMRQHIDGVSADMIDSIIRPVSAILGSNDETTKFSVVNSAINHAQNVYSGVINNTQANLGPALISNLQQQIQGAIEVQMKEHSDQANRLLAEISKAQENAKNQFAEMKSTYAFFKKEIEANRGNLEKEIEATRGKSQKLLESIEKIASESGVGAHANFFADQVKQHETFSFRWLWGTIVAAGLLILWIGGSGFLESILPAGGLTWWTRALIALVLTSLLAYSVKNYMAHKHNAVVNKHRENALRTYKALVESAPTQETRDIVLHHAAACIYAPQDSGYVKDSGKTQPAPMPVAIRTTVDG